MHIANSFEEVADHRPSVCTVGMFDGVHLGHRALIGATVSDAQSRGLRSVVVTFFPHPRQVLSGKPVLTLTPPAEKARLIGALGCDLVVMLRFTEAMAAWTAAHFVDQMVAYLGLRQLWVGHDFALGRDRAGGTAQLAALGLERGFGVHVVPPIDLSGGTISSTRIRQAVQRGEWEEVRQLLGRDATPDT